MTCAEVSCLRKPNDFVRLACSSPTGSMVVEIPLCDYHIASYELSTSGQYLFIRPARESERTT